MIFGTLEALDSTGATVNGTKYPLKPGWKAVKGEWPWQEVRQEDFHVGATVALHGTKNSSDAAHTIRLVEAKKKAAPAPAPHAKK